MEAAEGEAPGGSLIHVVVFVYVVVFVHVGVFDEERWGHHDGDADVRVLALPAEARSRRGELKRRGRRYVGRRYVGRRYVVVVVERRRERRPRPRPRSRSRSRSCGRRGSGPSSHPR